MQTIWKGTVSFGLVSIPVRLYAATEERGVSFRQVHHTDGGRIRYKRVCELDGEEVAYRDIAKGYEMPDGEMVILESEDFDSLPLSSSRVIDVLQFVPDEQLDPLMMNRAYYLSADGPGAKPYVLLRDALQRTGRAAIVKVALRNREQLAALSTRGDVLVLQTMLWPDEVRDAGGLAPDEDVTVRDQEVAMAESYIETLTADFVPDDYTDEYRAALEQLISAKAGGRPLDAPDEPSEQDGKVVDLMAALRASVEAAKARRGAAVAGSGEAGAGAARTGAGADAAGADEEEETAAPASRRKTSASTPARAGASRPATGKRAGKAPAAQAPGSGVGSSRTRKDTAEPASRGAAAKGATKKAAGTGKKAAAKKATRKSA
jgi:DNA end-binding protein Ku